MSNNIANNDSIRLIDIPLNTQNILSQQSYSGSPDSSFRRMITSTTMSRPLSTSRKPQPQQQQKQQLTALQQVLVIDPHGDAIINDTTLHPISLYDIYRAGYSISSSLREFTQVFHLLLEQLQTPKDCDSSTPQLACFVSHFLQTLDIAIPILVNALEAELDTMLHDGGLIGDGRVLDTELCAYR